MSTTLMDTTFVPADLDAASWDAIAPLIDALRTREVRSAGDFERWLVDRSELDAACSEARANLYITMTCRTDDKEASGAWTRYLDEVPPRLKPASFELDKQQVALHARFPMARHRYEVLERDTRVEVELFRDANVPIETDLAKLDQKYDEICGGLTVEFDGQTRTLPQMARYQQDKGRDVRERAWRTVAERRLQEKDAIEAIFDEMIAKRHQIALNAGFANFRDWSFRAKKRFDYTPAMCRGFHEAVEKHVVPFNRRCDARRKQALGVGTLRPWDLGVDEKGREPLRPFEGGQQLVEKTRRVFDRLDPQLAGMFRGLGENAARGSLDGAMLDLDSRKGKAAGGYQYMRDRTRKPFIFMNAAGLNADVHTMVHEAGHMFHSELCKGDPLVAYRHSPIEFAEVASMSMELLTMPEWDAYYPDPSHNARAKREQLEGSVGILAWIAQIDAFQHWLYENPAHSRAERTGAWLELDQRFGRDLDWSNLEEVRAHVWHRQSHLFGVPFYYIEYGIAQLGALGLWRLSLTHGRPHALGLYRAALTLGGSRPLPELFKAAGQPFDFGPARVAEIVGAVETELAKIEE
ncbi:MAG: M3 family oligoendopeptidase [Phycisphaerales bacterium]